MEINNFIFIFSLFVFLIGFVVIVLTSQEFKKMSNGKFKGGAEAGPRAELFNAIYDLLSEDKDSSKVRESKKARLKQFIDEMN